MESLRREQEFIDVKTAVQTALDHVRQLYEENEEIRNLGLEEVKLASEDNSWLITVGFSRPWSRKNVDESPMAPILNPDFTRPRPYPIERDYKQVRIDAQSGEVRGMEIRKL